MNDLRTQSMAALLADLRARRLGAEELTRAYMARIERYDGPRGLNAVAELDASALGQARELDDSRGRRELPLYGLPILVKDNIDVAGLHTTAGSLALADNLATADAPIVARLRRNGAIILGKTHMTEFANYTTQDMPNGYSSQGGQVRNAYPNATEPSGSSSGSAVAVAAGLCAAAIGTDTSFSVIGCATVNGVVGLKPAHGALSGAGIVTIAHTLDSAGPLTRTLPDALRLYACMRESPPPAIQPIEPARLRVAVNTHNRGDVSAAQLARYEALFASLRAAGAAVGEVCQPHTPCMRDIMRCEFRHDLEAYLAGASARRKTLASILRCYDDSPARMERYGVTYLRAALDDATGKLDDAPYRLALEERKRLRAQALAELRDYDACVMTGPTNLMHFIGLPSVALKLGMAEDDTPRGLILYGASEERLFAAALTLERFCPPVEPPKVG